MSALLEVTGLSVERGGRRVVDVERLAIAPGEVLAVIGPNGAGKSSLLHGLALLEPARFAQYRWAGRAVRLPEEAQALRREMAVVFQQPLLLDGSVLENVGMGLKLRGQPASRWRQEAQAMLDRLAIGHLAQRPARQLSGGEAQRVSIARALATRPRLIYLDEPFGALDVLARSALLRDLKALLTAEGTAALFVTHDFTEIPPLADRVAVMDSGRVVQIGTPQAVFNQPATDLVRELVQVAHDLVRTLRTPR
ncbi:MAG: ABC transporter ATP-binding protein [Bacillota bacterium]